MNALEQSARDTDTNRRVAATSDQEEEERGKRTSSSRLKLDTAGVNRIIQQTLGSAGGLADIFQGEQTAGIYNSSVSAQAAGDFASKLIGELATITGETITSEDTQNKVLASTKDLTTDREVSTERANTVANTNQTQTQANQTRSRSDTEQEDEGLLKRIFG